VILEELEASLTTTCLLTHICWSC